ncbi:ac4 [Choristoneura murinana nucleopolyhedrovirus]|uniref:Ac4 n=1 Tax=Choristoneura murinana nucleopolyhedrovirus TaxID=1987479 RepID=V9XSV6_9ABAC|nr:ac4 [Choristoneura murinana nucleopolyhedrovirus]AHD25629.1 ac4 [Choristoneura murinana nucleopolyhedrovirus]
MPGARFVRFSLRLTQEFKQNIVAHTDHLSRLRALIDGKVASTDVRRFGFPDRDALVAACMAVNVQAYVPDGTISLQPKLIYYRVCQNCNAAADVPAPDDHSIARYLCAECGTPLVIDHPLHVFGETEEGVNELLEVQRINAGGDL